MAKVNWAKNSSSCGCCGCDDLEQVCLSKVLSNPWVIDLRGSAGFCASMNNFGPNFIGVWELAHSTINPVGTEFFGFGIPNILGGAPFWGSISGSSIAGTYIVKNTFDPSITQSVTLTSPPC